MLEGVASLDVMFGMEVLEGKTVAVVEFFEMLDSHRFARRR